MELPNIRLIYDKTGLSQKIATPKGLLQIKLDLTNLSFKIINATNNLTLFEKSGTKSSHVLKRWAKKELEVRFGVTFKKEQRPSRRGKNFVKLKTG